MILFVYSGRRDLTGHLASKFFLLSVHRGPVSIVSCSFKIQDYMIPRLRALVFDSIVLKVQ